MQKNKKLFLIDGMALIYRAYYAMIKNPLTSSAGLNTSAIYGFMNSLLKLIKDERPDDLITAQQAAQMSGKSKNTIRAWVRQEKLTGYRQNPKKSNSALMISRAELMVFLATEATPTPTESRIGRPEAESASIAKLRLENQELQLLFLPGLLEILHLFEHFVKYLD